jgi:hypothetical protein
MDKYSFLVYSPYLAAYYEDLYQKATLSGTVPFEGKIAVDFLKLSNISPVRSYVI